MMISRLVQSVLPQDEKAGASEAGTDVSGRLRIITLKSSGAKLEYPENAASLLDVLEHYGISVEYQCRSGYCGACRCRMTSGEVMYRQQPLARINNGEILPCSCIPESDIELDI